MQSEDALTPWLTPRCLWTGCVSCPALLCSFLLLPPAGVVICILGADSVSRAHSAKQIFAVGQQEEWNYWPGRFFVPSDPMSVGYLRKRPPMLNFLPPYPTNNKLAKHEPESSSEGKRETTFPDPVGQHSLSATATAMAAAANIAGQKMGLSCATASRAAVEGERRVFGVGKFGGKIHLNRDFFSLEAKE